MWDGDGDGAKDEGDDREEKHRPRERGLVLRPTVAIAEEEQRRLEISKGSTEKELVAIV